MYTSVVSRSSFCFSAQLDTIWHRINQFETLFFGNLIPENLKFYPQFTAISWGFFWPIGQPSSPTSFRWDSSQSCELANPSIRFQCYETILLSSFSIGMDRCPAERWSYRLTGHKLKETWLLPWSRCIFHCLWFPQPNEAFLDLHLLCSPTPCMTLPIAEWHVRRMQEEISPLKFAKLKLIDLETIWINFHQKIPHFFTLQCPVLLSWQKSRHLDLWLLFRRGFLTV